VSIKPDCIRDPAGRRFFNPIIDYATNYTAIYRQRASSLLFSSDIQHFIAMVELPASTCQVQPDGALVGYAKDRLGAGYPSHVTAPGSSQSNGKIERRIRTVVAACAQMTLALLPATFFPPCMRLCRPDPQHHAG
jgi:hypothetical protein